MAFQLRLELILQNTKASSASEIIVARLFDKQWHLLDVYKIMSFDSRLEIQLIGWINSMKQPSANLVKMAERAAIRKNLKGINLRCGSLERYQLI